LGFSFCWAFFLTGCRSDGISFYRDFVLLGFRSDGFSFYWAEAFFRPTERVIINLLNSLDEERSVISVSVTVSKENCKSYTRVGHFQGCLTVRFNMGAFCDPMVRRMHTWTRNGSK